jgi:hypothetical protein
MPVNGQNMNINGRNWDLNYYCFFRFSDNFSCLLFFSCSNVVCKVGKPAKWLSE